jgi:hypothetical protein
MRDGRECPASGADILDKLKVLARSSRILSLIDIIGRTRRVAVLPGIEEQESRQQGDLAREVLAVVRMVSVDAYDGLVSFRWGVSAWDKDDVWGR